MDSLDLLAINSSQALFIYLLISPNTTSIPSLYRAGTAVMAEELG